MCQFVSICHCSFMWKIRKIPCWFFIKLETPHFRLVLGLCAPKSLEQHFLKKPNPTNFYLIQHSNFFSRVWSLQFHWILKVFWVVCFFVFFCRTWFSLFVDLGHLRNKLRLLREKRGAEQFVFFWEGATKPGTIP